MMFGFGVLGLSSREFWSLTPREINAALEAHRGRRTAAPSRLELTRLMSSFPDKSADGSTEVIIDT